MAPTVSRGYPPQSLSNPFGHISQQQHHQQSHLQHPSGLGGHGFSGAHHAFGGGQNGGLSLFGAPQQQQGSGAFGSAHHQQIPGFPQVGGVQHHLQAQAQAQAHHGHAYHDNATSRDRIREVWKSNLEEEFAIIRQLIPKYPYVSMDTEFPGVVARPIADDFGTKASYHYQTLRCNVDLLKIIQLGITLFNAEGEVPPPNALDGLAIKGMAPGIPRVCPATWTFNFKFSLDEDMYAADSIELLKKAGHDFTKHASFGIEFQEFGSLLITSGLSFGDDVNWISFHSGYDFGYLMKVMWCKMLPSDEDSYRRLIHKFFPNIYDVKYILRHAQRLRDKGAVTTQAANVLQSIGMKSSLQDLADELGCVRHGTQHDAGSDAWLTGSLYFEIRKRIFDGQIPDELKGHMWGLTGVGPPASAAAQAAALHQAAQLNQAAAANGILASGLYHPVGFRGDHREGGAGGPSTPTTNPAGLASTPNQGFGATPAGGVFGNFQYGK